MNNNALLSPTNSNLNSNSDKQKLDEDNFMHQLEVFYKKNTDFTYSIVKKSALESNMFSRQRVTLEGMIKAKNSIKLDEMTDDHLITNIFQK